MEDVHILYGRTEEANRQARQDAPEGNTPHTSPGSSVSNDNSSLPPHAPHFQLSAHRFTGRNDFESSTSQVHFYEKPLVPVTPTAPPLPPPRKRSAIASAEHRKSSELVNFPAVSSSLASTSNLPRTVDETITLNESFVNHMEAEDRDSDETLTQSSFLVQDDVTASLTLLTAAEEEKPSSEDGNQKNAGGDTGEAAEERKESNEVHPNDPNLLDEPISQPIIPSKDVTDRQGTIMKPNVKKYQRFSHLSLK